MITTHRFLNPFTDSGFKKIFGEETNKDMLIHFLNTLELANMPQRDRHVYEDSLKS